MSADQSDAGLLDAAPPRTIVVRLPVGYVDAERTVHREAALRKLRGSDEALLYDGAVSGAELVTRLLHACVVRLGPLAPVPAPVIDQLTSADRNYLLFELRRFTFGDEWRAVYACPACDTVVRRVEDLSAFAVRRLAEGDTLADVAVELEDGYQDRTGVAHRAVVARLPRGTDEAFVGRFGTLDPRQARDALLLRCIRRFGTLSQAALESHGTRILDALSLGDRQRLQRAFAQATPGVEFQRAVTCPACGLDYEGIADVTDFFGVS